VIEPGSLARGTRHAAHGTQLPLLAAEPSARPLPVLEEHASRGATFHEVPVKAILNSPATTGMGFWSLNPYVGCEFGCTYCYARETHKWVVERAEQRSSGAVEQHVPRSALPVPRSPLQSPYQATEHAERGTRNTERASLPPWLAFEKRILVKTTAAAVLRRTLFPAKLAGASLVIGTATDPYQPAERRFRLTRSILEALLGWRGLRLGIITKSPLILRDLDLLRQLAARHDLTVNISLCSTDAALLRRIEARSPAPHARLRALERLSGAGIHAGLLVAPILPGLSDSRESLSVLLAAGRAAGARYAVGYPLRVGPATRERLLPHLAREFPELAERYARHFNGRDNASREYLDALAARFRSLQREFGFPVTDRPTGAGGRYRRESPSPRPPATETVQWGLPIGEQ
jgi:DNA repair photolyase